MAKKTLKIKQMKFHDGRIDYFVDGRVYPIGFSKQNVIKLLGGSSNVKVGYWLNGKHYRDRYGKLKCCYDHTYDIIALELAKKSIVEQGCNYIIEVI